MASCAHAPIVSDPGEPAGSPSRGVVTPLSSQLLNKKRLIVVFVHGVGDTCPGYAIESQDPLLKRKSLEFMGLFPGADKTVLKGNIPVQDFVAGHRKDDKSHVTYRVLHYELRRPNLPGLPTDIVEITWSQLTQWLKTNRLGFDVTTPTPAVGSIEDDCPYTTSAVYKPPPSREKVNRLLKEGILDRNLTDAVIYSGRYGRIIRRGVADALCLAPGGTQVPGGVLCHWPSPLDENVRVIFVTHSLGSRIVYDTLFGLTGQPLYKGESTFGEDDTAEGKLFLNRLLADTSAVYMMANQLPLVGLAFEDGSSTSDDAPKPTLTQDLQLGSELRANASSESAAVATLSATKSLVGIAQIRSRALAEFGQAPESLHVVAFSDTNDLLTWGVPKWYDSSAGGAPFDLQITNVYVQTSFHFPFIEWPTWAHRQYFDKKSVWRVIWCGTDAPGHVARCPGSGTTH